MPVLKPDIHLHDLPVSCHIIPCNWQDRKEHNLSFTSLAQLSQGPEVPLGCLQPSCWDAFAAYLQNQWRIIISGLYQAGKFLCDVPYLVSRELTHLLCAEFSEHVRPLKRELPITTTLLFSLIAQIVMTGSTSQSLPQSPVLRSLSTSSLSSTTRIISLMTPHTVFVPAALWEQHQVLVLPRA